jgi:transposase
MCCRRRRAFSLRRCCWVAIGQPLRSSCSELQLTPDRTTESADILWKTLSPKQRSKVRAGCMDMWQAYETSTETNAPNALIVHDRFHISKHLNEAVDKVRRAEHRELQQTGDDRLKGMRQTLLFNPENLSDEKNDELAALRKSTLATGRAWSIKELFCSPQSGRWHVC